MPVHALGVSQNHAPLNSTPSTSDAYRIRDADVQLLESAAVMKTSQVRGSDIDLSEHALYQSSLLMPCPAFEFVERNYLEGLQHR